MSLPAFGVRNPVPANLLMVAALVIGVYSALTMRREFFPEVESQAAYIIAEYPGATPEEIEESIVYKLEDSLVGIDEIKQIKTTVREGSASIVTEFEDGVNVPKVLDEIERVVDQLQDLPADAERLRVTEMIPNMPVIQLFLNRPENQCFIPLLLEYMHVVICL